MYRIIKGDESIQGSPKWHDFRKCHLGASEAPIIMGISPWCRAHNLWEEKLGFRESKPVTQKMQRGMDLEPIARELCIDHHGINFIPKVIEMIEYPFLSASLDGILEDENIILEIKCPNQDTHNLALRGYIKDYYMCQMQHQMMVSGFDRCLYMSYNPEHQNPIAYVDVHMDEKFIGGLFKMEKHFWKCVCNIEEFTPIDI